MERDTHRKRDRERGREGDRERETERGGIQRKGENILEGSKKEQRWKLNIGLL